MALRLTSSLRIAALAGAAMLATMENAPAQTHEGIRRRAKTAKNSGTSTTEKPVTNAALEGVVNLIPLVWKAYPPNMQQPITAPARKLRAVNARSSRR